MKFGLIGQSWMDERKGEFQKIAALFEEAFHPTSSNPFKFHTEPVIWASKKNC